MNITKDETYLINKIKSFVKKNSIDNKIINTMFLDIRKKQLVLSELNKNNLKYSEISDFNNNDYTLIVIGEQNLKSNDFITTYHFETIEKLSHQKILGSLLSLGINRDVIGDIYCDENNNYFSCTNQISTFISENLVVINKEYIKLNKISYKINKIDNFNYFDIIVSSFRLDSIISAITKCSRNDVKLFFENEFIKLNYNIINKYTITCKIDDILSIRKYGRYKIIDIKGYSKKNKVILKIGKYI